ncbi:MAG: TonB-dependent receptor [Chitinophagaceae bacterium]|nr:TonB-dependent receptor [Chitinophagaceae bacterium]
MKKLMLIIGIFTALKTYSQTDTMMSRKVDSVTVLVKKPFIQMQVDKVVMNIESRPTAAGQNALELLKQAPSVLVDANENIQMGGKNGVQILIDGRNTNMSSQDVAQLLKSIEASNIKEIELITNPSAKYDAAGNAGIINIKLKKSITNGFNGNATTTYQQSTHARNNINGAFNFRRNKINWYANMGLGKGFQNTIANNDRITAPKNYTQRSIESDDYTDNNVRTGVDYNINKKNTLGILWMHNQHNTTMDNNSNTLVQQTTALDTNVRTRSLAPFTNGRNNFNFNYKFSFNGEELNVDADYTKFNSALNNTVSNELSNQNNIKFANNTLQNNAAIGIQLSSIKIDYSKKIKSNTNIEGGIKTVFTNTNSNLNIQNYTNNSWLQDTGKNNRFTYKERMNAAYLNFNTSVKKFTFQMGLRAELTTVKGNATNLKNQSFNGPDTSYINLFPTVFVQYKLSDKHQLGMNYGKRIDRPSYQDQNPFVYVLDAFNSEVGNPYLMPQITHAVELSYTYKYASSIKIKYASTTNYIEQLTYQNGSNTVMVPQNAGSRQTINLSLSTPFQPDKWWNGYLSAEPYWQQYSTIINGYGVNTSTKQNSVGFNGYLGNWFTLKHNWKAELSGWFNYQNTTTIYTSKPIGSINIGASKNFLNNKVTLRCSINDVFNTQRWQQTVNTINVNIVTYRKWESRNISLSLNYRFGNTKIKAARERETGTEGELGRIKSK